MKKLLFLSLLALSMGMNAQKPIVVKLWPNGAPNNNGITVNEKVAENGHISLVSVPELIIYPASKPNGQAIIACPGGAYALLAMRHEGTDMASWFNNQGITYAVLKYRMPNGHSEVPLSDAHQAIKYMREHQSDFKFTKLGIMGSSAGGHLASTAATHYTPETRPDFQVLFYPVISMDPTITHMGSRTNLLGENPTKKDVELFSNELQITKDTPQAFIMQSSDDGAVPVANGINYYMALVKNHVPVSLHMYPIGGHGWGYNESFTYKPQWKAELEKWLREINR